MTNNSYYIMVGLACYPTPCLEACFLMNYRTKRLVPVLTQWPQLKAEEGSKQLNGGTFQFE